MLLLIHNNLRKIKEIQKQNTTRCIYNLFFKVVQYFWILENKVNKQILHAGQT